MEDAKIVPYDMDTINGMEIEDKKAPEDTKELMQEMFQNEEFRNMWIKMHTPWRAKPAVGRNEICPFCASGKKFKNCSCYEKYKDDKYVTIDGKSN